MILVAIVGCAGSPTPAGGAPATASLGASPDRTGECRALIDVINRGVAALEKMDGYAGLDDLERMAVVRGDMAREIDGVHPTRPELRAWAAEYGKTVRETAAALRGVATAARRGDAVRGDGQRDLDAAMKKEEPLVDRINALCQGP
jgi:hypothetical protein